MMNRTYYFIGFGAVAAIVLVIYLGYEFDRWIDPFDDEPFDQSVWIAADPLSKQRGPMARDAMTNVPVGTSKDEVLEILGQPCYADNRSIDSRKIALLKARVWTYGIGSWSAIGWYGFDSAWLAIYFDADGKVIATKIDGG